MIYIAGITIALFISTLLLFKRNKSSSDTFLLLWMILNAAHLSLFYLLHTGDIYNYPFLLGLQFPLPLLHGVLLYYYVSAVTNQFPKNKKIALLHLLPALATLIYLIPFYFSPANYKIEVFKNDGKGYELFLGIILLSTIIVGIVYVVWTILLLRNHKKQIRDQFSDLEEIDLKWLQLLVYGLGIIWLIVIIFQNDIFIHLGQAVFVVLVGFFGIQQKNIFKSERRREHINESIDNKLANKLSDTQEELVNKEKYISSGLSDENEARYYTSLTELIENEKVYTDPELSLSDLAEKLKIHPNYLSQIINKKENKNFYAYINDYRIEEFKKLISDPENRKFTLISVAYDCGFNSKSSFNRYFKKSTNLTPSQYVKALQNDGLTHS